LHLLLLLSQLLQARCAHQPAQQHSCMECLPFLLAAAVAVQQPRRLLQQLLLLLLLLGLP
jgi:hypothetical protein